MLFSIEIETTFTQETALMALMYRLVQKWFLLFLTHDQHIAGILPSLLLILPLLLFILSYLYIYVFIFILNAVFTNHNRPILILLPLKDELEVAYLLLAITQNWKVV